MSHVAESVEFDAIVDEHGRLTIPVSLVNKSGGFTGRRFHVRLTDKSISSKLSSRKVSEEEVDRIAGLQLETREQVVKFLLSEGGLRKTKRGAGRATG
jgi:hypothetical protein